MSEAKYLLQKIAFLDAEINSLIREHESVKSTLLKATDYSNEPVATTKRNASEDKLVKLADKSSDIDLKIDELVDFKITMGNHINQLEDERHRVILREHYINGLSFCEISDILGYTERHLHRIHGEALLAFQNVLKDVS
jgi:DNA-directed RNA polymerase specialized sigma subunit